MLLKQARVLLIDDDADVLVALRLLLKSQVKEVKTEKSPGNIPSLLLHEEFDVVILDMNFNGMVNTGNEGLYWLKRIKEINSKTQVILITAYGEIDLAIRSLKEGASDFIVKPWQNDKILESLKELLREKKKSPSNKKLSIEENEIIGESEEIQDIFSKIKKVAPTDANILILGENGTGKDLFARAIHDNSQRREKPFIKVDVGSLTPTLFESELFGHKKGAFTDAREDRKGWFELANSGTLFLDEIGNITLNQQAKLLTVLQNRKISPLGSSESISIDIRLITATNLNISELSDESKFRKDLIYRINTVDLIIPPLRYRGNDITVIAKYFLDNYVKKYNKQELKLDQSFLQKLKNHSFPGNVRELQFIIERAVIMSENILLTDKDISFSAIETSTVNSPDDEVKLETVEKNTILKVIDRNKGNISRSAKELGITRAALYRRLDKYDL